MNYLNPHTHDLSGSKPKGFWIARPECIETHDLFAKGLEARGGFRDRGEGYDHEHWETTYVDREPTPPAAFEPTTPEPITLPEYTAGLSIRDREGKQVLELTITGSAHVVAAILTWSGDAFKEDQER